MEVTAEMTIDSEVPTYGRRRHIEPTLNGLE